MIRFLGHRTGKGWVDDSGAKVDIIGSVFSLYKISERPQSGLVVAIGNDEKLYLLDQWIEPIDLHIPEEQEIYSRVFNYYERYDLRQVISSPIPGIPREEQVKNHGIRTLLMQKRCQYVRYPIADPLHVEGAMAKLRAYLRADLIDMNSYAYRARFETLLEEQSRNPDDVKESLIGAFLQLLDRLPWPGDSEPMKGYHGGSRSGVAMLKRHSYTAVAISRSNRVRKY